MTYEERKKTMREYVFSTPYGYRKFFVLGITLSDAEENFMKCSDFQRKGFSLVDLPVRHENTNEEH